MAGTGRVNQFFRVCPFYHSASVPPVMEAGMSMQAFVPRLRGSAAGGPGRLTKSERREKRTDFMRVSGVESNNYWSSTTNADNPDNAWNVNLNNGNVNNDNKDNNNYVWPVRGGE